MNTGLDGFVRGIPGFTGLASRTQNEWIAYFFIEVAGNQSFTASDIAEARKHLGLERYRDAADLSERCKRNGAVPPAFCKLTRGYKLHRSKADELSGILSKGRRESSQQTTSVMRRYLARLRGHPREIYLEEAIGCYESKFHHAAVVFAWATAYDTFRQWLFDNHLADFNTVASLWRKPITISDVEDFESLTERVVIDTAKTCGAIKKEAHKTLVSLLDKRNSVAHPTGKVVTPTAVDAYLEEIVSEVILKY